MEESRTFLSLLHPLRLFNPCFQSMSAYAWKCFTQICFAFKFLNFYGSFEYSFARQVSALLKTGPKLTSSAVSAPFPLISVDSDTAHKPDANYFWLESV